MSAAPQRLNKYELRTPIGRGSAGEVWKAYDLQQHTDVAIKLLHSDLQADPHFFTHFTVEGQAIASLQHDNIVKIHEINVARPAQSNETIAYIAMDYIEGQTLATYIHATSHKANFPTLPQITYLFTCLGKAIDYAHAQGLSHGDLKPSNILLNARDRFQFEGGEPMLTDFALANILGNNVTTASPIYMSPEQAQGQAAIPRSDIYTLGVILYEFCTGVQPFRADSAVEIMKQHINVLPTPPVLINPHVPYALSEVILRAMAKNPSTRFPSASALATAVADACSLQSTNYAPSAQEFDDESDPQQNSSILGVAQPPASNPPRSPRPTHPIQTRPLNIPASLSGLHSNSSEHTATQPTPPIPPTIVTAQHRAMIPRPAVQPPTVDQFYAAPLQTPSLPPMVPQVFPEPKREQPTQNISQVLPPLKRRSVNEVPLPVVVASLLLLLVVIGSVIGASLLHNRPAAQATVTPKPIARVFFQDDALGFNDQLRFDLQNTQAPPNGKSYMAWLKTTHNQLQPLGQFTTQNNASSLLYTGNGNHANLLAITQGVEITLEDTGAHPTTPGGTVVYQGQFDANVLRQLQTILYVTPNFPGHQSVVKGLLDTIKSMNDKAGSVVDSRTQDPQLAKRQAVRIIELIDGTAYARSSGDLPAQEPALLNTQVGLLSSPKQPGYIDTLAAHLAQLKQSNTATATDGEILQHMQNVENAITDLRAWVQQLRGYATTIIKASSMSSSKIANTTLQLQQLSADTYTGRTIPPHQGPQPILGSAGAYQAYVESQYLASLNLAKA